MADGKKEQTKDLNEYSGSGGLTEFLSKHNISLAFSSYQSGILYFLGRKPDGGIQLHQCGASKPMGLYYNAKGGLLLSAGSQIWHMENTLAANERANQIFDACFVPRQIHNTGSLDSHDIVRDWNDRVLFVNTRFNCIATTSTRHSFVPVWKPPFIDAIVDEDRCHLNGMAIAQEGEVTHVTALSRSNTIDGWRDRRADGGVVIDVRSNKIVCEGLSMPHSPRWHDGELWIANSGTGEIGVVEGLETGMGTFKPRAFCPGFLRGLSFHGGHAFVGLSRPRYKRFEGLALDARLVEADSEAWCGIQIIDISKGTCVNWFRIDGPVMELYDVTAIPGYKCPMAIAPGTREIANLITWSKESEFA